MFGVRAPASAHRGDLNPQSGGLKVGLSTPTRQQIDRRDKGDRLIGVWGDRLYIQRWRRSQGLELLYETGICRRGCVRLYINARHALAAGTAGLRFAALALTRCRTVVILTGLAAMLRHPRHASLAGVAGRDPRQAKRQQDGNNLTHDVQRVS